MRLSIVSTLYNTEPWLLEFHKRATKVAKEVSGEDYEIILVNDSSPDKVLDLAIKVTEDDSHVVVLDLSRNFGQHKAIMTGLEHARGEYLFYIDSDLEEEPECLISFMMQMENEHCDVVYGVQESRKGNGFERLSGGLFYSIFNFVAGMRIPKNHTTVRLMTRCYVEALLRHKEREIFLAGIFHITGFNQQSKIIKKLNTKTSSYTFAMKVSMFIDSITSFTNTPLVGIFYIGLFISIVAFCFTGYVIVQWMFLDYPLLGWTSLISSLWLLGGMIITFVGIIGIYLAKIFSETKQRPYTIIKRIHAKKR